MKNAVKSGGGGGGGRGTGGEEGEEKVELVEERTDEVKEQLRHKTTTKQEGEVERLEQID